MARLLGRVSLVMVLVVVGLLFAGRPAQAAVFVETNTNDSGAGSLRKALEDANGSGGADLITFASPLNDPGSSRDGGSPALVSLA